MGRWEVGGEGEGRGGKGRGVGIVLIMMWWIYVVDMRGGTGSAPSGF
jgi:hypothetical protein